jgi:hypothetical protein
LPTAFRPARPDDFDFCARPYFAGMAGMEETIRQLKLDMVKQSANLRERWNVSEVRIITSDGTDVGWICTGWRPLPVTDLHRRRLPAARHRHRHH